MGDGVLALTDRHHRHLLAIAARPAHRALDPPGKRHGNAVHNRKIVPVNVMGLEQSREAAMRQVRFRRDHQAGRVLVDPVDDAGAALSADAREGAGAVMQQRVHQGAAGVAGGGVDHQSCGFVDHDQMIVLEHHIQRDGLRLQIDVDGRRQFQREGATFMLAARSARHFYAVDGEASFGNQRLHPLS